jgi:hypothetical protein
MISRTYLCNFCRQILEFDFINKDKENYGYAVKWEKGRLKDIGVHHSDTEDHICRKCIRGIKGFAPSYIDRTDELFK